jgi:hypothetical protein
MRKCSCDGSEEGTKVSKLSILTVMAVVLASGAAAADPAAPNQACIQAVSHVVATVTKPADCCTGRMQCSQFLSTAIVARPAQPQRT